MTISASSHLLKFLCILFIASLFITVNHAQDYDGEEGEDAPEEKTPDKPEETKEESEDTKPVTPDPIVLSPNLTTILLMLNDSLTTVIPDEATTTAGPVSTTTRAPLSPCEELLSKSDGCISDALFIGQSSAYIPQNVQDMEEYCEQKKENFMCVREYGVKCLKNIPRQVFMSIYKNIRKLFKTFCSSDAGKTAFLKHMECVKPDDVKILSDVLGKLTLSLTYAARNVSRDKIITYACCSLHKTYDDIPAAVSNLCAPRPTNPETVAFFRGLIKKVVGDILDVGCGRFSNLEYCDQNLKEGMGEIRKLVNTATELPKTSFIVPLIEFTTKIDGN